MVSTDTIGWASLPLSGDKSSGFHSLFAGGSVGEATAFLVALACSRVAIISKFSVLLGCPSPGPLARQSRLSFGSFYYYSFLSVLVGISMLPAFPVTNHGYMKKKEDSKDSKLCHFLILRFLEDLTSSLHVWRGGR